MPVLPASLQNKDAPSERPSYLPVHCYTILQIVLTIVVFILTLTKAAPAFPVLIIALVPFRLLIMNRMWNRKVLRFVDAWACREGTPEDDEDHKTQRQTLNDAADDAVFTANAYPLNDQLSTSGDYNATTRVQNDVHELFELDNAHEWIELDSDIPRASGDEEVGPHT